jgi:hypothetical protein
MTSNQIKDRFTVVRARKTNVFVDEDEAVQMYFKTPKMNFAIGVLPPGCKTPMDPGEPGIYIAYVLEGEAIFEAGDESKETEWLYEGDAILVRENLPHIVYNPAASVSRVIWALAPGHGEE